LLKQTAETDFRTSQDLRPFVEGEKFIKTDHIEADFESFRSTGGAVSVIKDMVIAIRNT
jgi:hypothetical protein